MISKQTKVFDILRWYLGGCLIVADFNFDRLLGWLLWGCLLIADLNFNRFPTPASEQTTSMEKKWTTRKWIYFIGVVLSSIASSSDALLIEMWLYRHQKTLATKQIRVSHSSFSTAFLLWLALRLEELDTAFPAFPAGVLLMMGRVGAIANTAR